MPGGVGHHSHVTPRKTAKKLYRYYVCFTAHQHGWDKCPTRSVSAPAIEEAVVAQIRSLGTSPTMIAALVREVEEDQLARHTDLEQGRRVARRELRGTNGEIGVVIGTASAKVPDAKLATDRSADLQDRASAIEHRIGHIQKQLVAATAQAWTARTWPPCFGISTDYGSRWRLARRRSW